MLCQSLLYSKVTRLYTYTFFFYVLFHYGLSQDIVYSSLCYTLGPCCFSILNVIVCIYQSQTLSPSVSLPPSLRDVCHFSLFLSTGWMQRTLAIQKVELSRWKDSGSLCVAAIGMHLSYLWLWGLWKPSLPLHQGKHTAQDTNELSRDATVGSLLRHVGLWQRLWPEDPPVDLDETFFNCTEF